MTRDKDARVVTFNWIEDAPCQAGPIKPFLKGQGQPCKKTARISIAGLNLCPVHAGALLTYGSVPAGEGSRVWEVVNSKDGT